MQSSFIRIFKVYQKGSSKINHRFIHLIKKAMPPKPQVPSKKPSAPTRHREPEKNPKTAKASTGTGWGAVAQKKLEDEQRKQRNEERKNSIWDFYLRDGESAVIQIINDDPVCIDGHTVLDDRGNFMFLPCQLESQKHCEMCRENSPIVWRAGFKVLDFRAKNKKGDYEYSPEPTEKKWLVGQGLAQQLKTYKDKKGKDMSELMIEISRSGSGAKDTSYNLQTAEDDEGDKLQPIEWEEKFPSIEDLCQPPTDEEYEDGGYTIPARKDDKSKK